MQKGLNELTLLDLIGLKKAIAFYSTMFSANTMMLKALKSTVNFEEQTMNTIEIGSRLWLVAYLQVRTLLNSYLKNKNKNN